MSLHLPSFSSPCWSRARLSHALLITMLVSLAQISYGHGVLMPSSTTSDQPPLTSAEPSLQNPDRYLLDDPNPKTTGTAQNDDDTVARSPEACEKAGGSWSNGNGTICNHENNIPECGYDGGDCCCSTGGKVDIDCRDLAVKGTSTETESQCGKCVAVVGKSNAAGKIGNQCDARNHHGPAACSGDGGDCDGMVVLPVEWEDNLNWQISIAMLIFGLLPLLMAQIQCGCTLYFNCRGSQCCSCGPIKPKNAALKQLKHVSPLWFKDDPRMMSDSPTERVQAIIDHTCPGVLTAEDVLKLGPSTVIRKLGLGHFMCPWQYPTGLVWLAALACIVMAVLTRYSSDLPLFFVMTGLLLCQLAIGLTGWHISERRVWMGVVDDVVDSKGKVTLSRACLPAHVKPYLFTFLYLTCALEVKQGLAFKDLLKGSKSRKNACCCGFSSWSFGVFRRTSALGGSRVSYAGVGAFVLSQCNKDEFDAFVAFYKHQLDRLAVGLKQHHTEYVAESEAYREMQGIEKQARSGLVMRQDTAGRLWLPEMLKGVPMYAELTGQYVKQGFQVNGKAWYSHSDEAKNLACWSSEHGAWVVGLLQDRGNDRGLAYYRTNDKDEVWQCKPEVWEVWDGRQYVQTQSMIVASVDGSDGIWLEWDRSTINQPFMAAEQSAYMAHVAKLAEPEFREVILNAVFTMGGGMKWVPFNDGPGKEGINGYESNGFDSNDKPVYVIKWCPTKNAPRMMSKYNSDHDPGFHDNDASDPKHAQPRVVQNVDVNRTAFTADSPEAMLKLWKHFWATVGEDKLLRLKNDHSLSDEAAETKFHYRCMLTNWLLECPNLKTAEVGSSWVWKSVFVTDVITFCGNAFCGIITGGACVFAGVVMLGQTSNSVSIVFGTLLLLVSLAFIQPGFKSLYYLFLGPCSDIRRLRAEAATHPQQQVTMVAEIQWILDPYLKGRKATHFPYKFARAEGNTDGERRENLLTDLATLTVS